MGLDKVTGLYFYDDYKEKAAELLHRGKSNCYFVAAMSIADFRYINEHYGYDKGEELLKVVTTDFYEKTKRYVLGCRIHSDKFSFLGKTEGVHPNVLAAELENELQKFSASFSEKIDQKEVRFHMGVYVPKGKEDVSRCLDKAESARKKNVKDSKNWITIYDDAMQDEYIEKNEILYGFQNAVQRKEMLVHIQPIKNVKKDEWQEAEVLARLIGPNGEAIMPEVFLPYLEKNGMISELDCIVLEKTCEILKKWENDKVKAMPLNLNLSSRDIRSDVIYARILEILNGYDIEPGLLGFEVKESSFLEDGELVKERIGKLREMGYRVCMDDFGSGYTYITDLAVLPVDMIKFARSFVHNCIGSKKGTTMLRGMIDIFHKIEMPCTCKGIENMLQERLVRECGCQLSQGDVLEAPMDVEKFERKYIYHV